MKSYDVLLFDWDGCIAETLSLVLKAYKETFAEYEKFPEDSFITKEIFGSWENPKKAGISDIDTFNAKYLARVEKEYLNVPLTDGAVETLTHFKNQQKKIVLVTTSHYNTVAPLLSKHKLQGIFDAYVTAEKVTRHKPDPESIYKALDLVQGEKETTIMIGDSTSDLGAAQNAGVDSALFFPESHRKFYDLADLTALNPTYTINQFVDLKTIIA